MTIQKVRTPDYNTDFNTITGNFRRWGATPEDDPQFSPIGPELADIEISTMCNGPEGVPCAHCYKSNTASGHNMTIDIFQKVLTKLPRSINQIAFGIGDLDANPDLFKIFQLTKDFGIVPNVTINGANLTLVKAAALASFCGAVAVSRYSNVDTCYNTVANLSNYQMKQINIHQLLSSETFDSCLQLIEDIKSDSRLKDLNAIVFLSLKQKGRGTHYGRVSDEQFDTLVTECFKAGIRFGFDSCTTSKFLRYLDLHPEYDNLGLRNSVEPCESSLFSIYVNVFGEVYPCSFCENVASEHLNPFRVSLLDPKINFMKDIWYGDTMDVFRTELLRCGRACPIYSV